MSNNISATTYYIKGAKSLLECKLIFNNIDLFTPKSKTKLYEKTFNVIDLSNFPEHHPSKVEPSGYCLHALFRSFITKLILSFIIFKSISYYPTSNTGAIHYLITFVNISIRN